MGKENIISFLQGAAIVAGFSAVLLFGAISLASCEDEEPSKSIDQQLSEMEEAQQEEALQAYYEEADYQAEQAGAIDWDEAEDHIGEYVTIYGAVEEVSQPGVSGDPIFVDIGNAYPDDRVTGVCWSEYHSAFDDLFSYEGNLVLMEGTLYMHEGTPNIELTDSSQIKAL